MRILKHPVERKKKNLILISPMFSSAAVSKASKSPRVSIRINFIEHDGWSSSGKERKRRMNEDCVHSARETGSLESCYGPGQRCTSQATSSDASFSSSPIHEPRVADIRHRFDSQSQPVKTNATQIPFSALIGRLTGSFQTS